ncbi:MAG: hypothetical protein PVI99_06835 [Anaerolineales bacterium]|jgi:hypothetical protein
MNTYQPGIYLIIEFDWPQPFEDEHGKLARALHDAVQEKDWIKESAAASGGVGGRRSSLWVFWLESYAALDRLFKDREDPVSQVYTAFFSKMAAVEDWIREEVYFV